jgi:hypothetical protein
MHGAPDIHATNFVHQHSKVKESAIFEWYKRVPPYDYRECIPLDSSIEFFP